MKKVLLSLAMLLAFAGTAQAESMKIGSQSLSYDAPKGYARTMDGMNEEVLRITQQAMPRDLKIHAMYTPKAIDEAFRNDPAAGLDAYLLITTTSRLDSQLLSEKDFKSLREALTKAQGEIAGGSIRKQVDEAWARVTDGAVKIGDVQSLGVFDENKTSLSFMTLMTQVTNVNGQQQAVQQAMISTTKLVKGKVVTINQYQMVRSESELKKFQDDALKVVKSMGFSEGGVSSSKSTISGGSRGGSSSSGMGRYMRMGLFGAIIGGGIGLGFSYYRRKKNGTTGNPKTDKMLDNIDDMKNKASEKLSGLLNKKDK